MGEVFALNFVFCVGCMFLELGMCSDSRNLNILGV